MKLKVSRVESKKPERVPLTDLEENNLYFAEVCAYNGTRIKEPSVFSYYGDKVMRLGRTSNMGFGNSPDNYTLYNPQLIDEIDFSALV